MKIHDDGDEDGDNDGNEYKNNNVNAASGSGSNGKIFDPIVTPRSYLGLTEEDRGMTMTALQP